jgi:uncharacterized membrane protein (DUF4010 family)
MTKRVALMRLRWAVSAAVALAVWQLLPDRYMGPHHAWNPHAIMEFVLTLFFISLASQWAVYVWGAHHGLLLTGLMGGFASSTATIHTMGAVAKSQPQFADRAALGAVLSNIATLMQLVVLLHLLAPQVLVLLMLPISFGMVGVCAYAARSLVVASPAGRISTATRAAVAVDWKSMLTLTALVCGVSYASAAMNAIYGQSGLWLGAALSGLVDAHAIVPTLASLLLQDKLQAHDALMPLLMALTANTLTKSLIAFQSGGWLYARSVSGGVWLTTAAVWLGYIAQEAGLGF